MIAAAQQRGIDTENLAPVLRHDVVRFRQGHRSQVVREGKIFESLSSLSEFLCQEKHVCKAVLSEVDVPSPTGIQFADAEASRGAIEDLLLHATPLVLKPSASEGGEGVFVDLRSYEDVHQHWEPQRSAHPHFVLEEQVAGVDLRIHVLDGRIVAACVRDAAHVEGDGEQSITELVNARQAVMRMQNAENKLELDEVSDRLLASQGLSRSTVPAEGQRVVLQAINNLALGGVAVDVTDDIHAHYGTWATIIATRFALPVLALDVRTPDPSHDPRTAAHVIEINAKPDWLHHTFSERRQHDIPGMLLERMFPA